MATTFREFIQSIDKFAKLLPLILHTAYLSRSEPRSGHPNWTYIGYIWVGIHYSSAFLKQFKCMEMGLTLYPDSMNGKFVKDPLSKKSDCVFDLGLLEDTDLSKTALPDGNLGLTGFLTLVATGKHPWSELLTGGASTLQTILDKANELDLLVLEAVTEYQKIASPTETKITSYDISENYQSKKFRLSHGFAKVEYDEDVRRMLFNINQLIVAVNMVNSKSASEFPETPNGNRVPLDDQPVDKGLLAKQVLGNWRARNAWNSDVPTVIELDKDRIEKMKDQVLAHCKLLSGFEIVDLRPVNLAYFSDGSYTLAADAINQPKSGYSVKRDAEGKHVVVKGKQDTTASKPCIYCGEAWRIYFQFGGKDYLAGHYVYFATPEQFVDAYKTARPDLLGDDWQPWSDLIFISSDYCERNGAHAKDTGKGIDIQTPHQKRVALWQWILGPFLGRCAYNKNPVHTMQVIALNGYENKTRLANAMVALGASIATSTGK